MTEESQASPHRRGIAIDSDWITAFGMVALLIVCVLWFVADVRRFMWNQPAGPAHVLRNFWSIWNSIFEAIAGVFLCMFTFLLPQKTAKIACALMGAKLASFVLLGCFNISSNVRHIAAVSGSDLNQMALLLFSVAIFQWLRGVIRWDQTPDPRGAER
jgi:hypothetical protein